jgi:hypothetical protein
MILFWKDLNFLNIKLFKVQIYKKNYRTSFDKAYKKRSTWKLTPHGRFMVKQLRVHVLVDHDS